MTKKWQEHPFDRHRLPPRQNWLLLPVIWLLCWLTAKLNRLKLRKHDMNQLKPPFLVLATHQAFMDFLVTPLALFPYAANYVSELEGFEYYGEGLYRQAGCLGTRKFVNDLALVRNIQSVMERQGILVLYPEARYANVGTHSLLPESTSKLIKKLAVPVVTLNMKGNYLQSPIWNTKKRKGVPLEADMRQLLTGEATQQQSLAAIQAAVQEALSYDEYAWQLEKQIAITDGKRAEGLHLVLYCCRVCRQEFKMNSCGSRLYCEGCGSSWEMTELGQLRRQTSGADELQHIPDWYEWQRQQVVAEIAAGSYYLEMAVQVQALPNAVNFIPLGSGHLTHSAAGFELACQTVTGRAQQLFFSSQSMYSIHTEYNYRRQGPCVVLSTLDNSYFLFLNSSQGNVTKIQFAVEHFYQLAKSQ